MSELINGRISAFDIAVDIFKGSISTSSDLHIYVDSVNGSDSNNGSKDKPFKTLQIAINSVPKIISHDVFIHILPGTYDAFTVSGFLWAGGNLVIMGEEVSEVASYTVESGSTSSSIVKSGLTADEHLGFGIEFTSGALKGQRRLVSWNTTSDIIPSEDFSEAPNVGDSYRIIRSTVVIELNSNNLMLTLEGATVTTLGPSFLYSGIDSSKLVLLNLEIINNANLRSNVSVHGKVVFAGVYGINTGEHSLIADVHGVLFLGFSSGFELDRRLFNSSVGSYFGISPSDWVGWGWGHVGLNQATGGLVTSGGSSIFGYACNVSLESVNAGNYIAIYGGSFTFIKLMATDFIFEGRCRLDLGSLTTSGMFISRGSRGEIFGSMLFVNGQNAGAFMNVKNNSSVFIDVNVLSDDGNAPEFALFANGGHIQTYSDPTNLSASIAKFRAGDATSNSLGSFDVGQLSDSNANPNGSVIMRSKNSSAVPSLPA